MQTQDNFSTLFFPDTVSFQFKKADDGQTIKLSFHSHIKMSEFIQDVIEKSYIAFNIPDTKKIEVIDSVKGEDGDPLESEDDTILSVKYANNYKNKAFYIRVV